MLKKIFQEFMPAILTLFFMTLLTGLIYPLLVTVIAQIFFPWQANGSLITENGKTIGSELIGQYFNAPEYFWGRPSATNPNPYNAALSSGSNMSPSNPAFLKVVQERIAMIKQFDHDNAQAIPVDLVTASGSGLDPDISPLAAFYQVPRIAKARHISEELLKQLIEMHIKTRTCMLLGQPRINVLELNLELNKPQYKHQG